MIRSPRHLALPSVVVFGLLAVPLPALAHGIGGRLDLPVPITVFVGAAGVVLVVTFVGLAVLWPEPRLQGPHRLAPGRRMQWLWTTFAAIGWVALLLVLASGAVGVDNPSRNPSAVIVFVGFWLIVPFVAGFLVDLYPALSPWPRLAAWVGIGSEERPELVERIGYWPATVVFLLFTWFELVAPDNGPRSIVIATVVFAVLMLVTSARWGVHTATQTVDGFGVYARFLGGMAPYTFEDGVWRRRPWLTGLVDLPERPGMAAFVVAMIGTVTFDGASSTTWWIETLRDPLVQGLLDAGLSLRLADVLVGTLWWAAVTGLVWLTYAGACSVAARSGGDGIAGRTVQRRFAHTLVPIGFAYAFAHYFSLVLFEGQLFVSSMSDPFNLGWDLFGTVDRPVDFTIVSTTVVWWVQVVAIVLGHIAGVVLSHDRALADFPAEEAVASQYAMLLLMVALTGLGLVVLSAG